MIDDSMGSDLRKRSAQERGHINIVNFDRDGSFTAPDADGTFPANMSPCTCSNRTVPHKSKKDTIFCPACGLETSIAKTKKEGIKNKQTRAGKNIFAISQQPREKRRDPDLPEGTTTISSIESTDGGQTWS